MHWSLERHDALDVATFTRPPDNQMSFEAMGELGELASEVAADASVSVLMLTGGVDGYFIAHADIRDLVRLGAGGDHGLDVAVWHRTLALLEDMPQPVVAAVNGQAWGGGCETSLACTLRWAAASATFGQPEVNVGIVPGAGGTQRLARLIGPGRAADLCLTGRIVTADEAVQLGIVNAVLPDDGFRDEAIRWASSLARKPRAALAGNKRAIIQGARSSFSEGLRLEGAIFMELQTREDTAALQRAALESFR